MPHLTHQISTSGPILDVVIACSTPREKALEKAKLPIPEPKIIRLLIDTGASCTCIDPAILAALGLTPTGAIPMHTPTTAGNPQTMPQYDVKLALLPPAGGPLRIFSAIAVCGTSMADQPFDGLLGRDVLSKCLFVYDGTDGRFSLAF